MNEKIISPDQDREVIIQKIIQQQIRQQIITSGKKTSLC